jgi:hypothetical protein
LGSICLIKLGLMDFIIHAHLNTTSNSSQFLVNALSIFGLLSDDMASSHHTATSFLKLLTQCPMAASSSQAGFAALLLAADPLVVVS